MVVKDPADPAKSLINYQGEEVAAVAATTEEIAQDAVRLITVDYEVLPALATVEQAMSANAPQAFPRGNVSQPRLTQEGDVEAAIKTAAHVVEGLYRTQVQTHVARDARRDRRVGRRQAAAARLDPGGERVARRRRRRPRYPEEQRARDHGLYGRRVRQQAGADVQLVIAAKLARRPARRSRSCSIASTST
jgi:hypothetical protein